MKPETNLTGYGGGSYERESESLHAELYRLHNAVAWDASDCLKRALTTLHEVEVKNADLRPVCKQYIAQFESLRDQVDALWKAAANLRSQLIHENGCDTSCEQKRGKAAYSND